MAKRTSPKTEAKTSSSQEFNAYVTFSPGAVIAGGFHLEERITDDLRRLRQGSVAAPSRRCPAVGADGVVGFDTEYDASGKLLTVGIASERSALAVEGDFKAAKKIIKKAKVIVGHSVPGDLDYLVRLGLARASWLRGLDIKDSLLMARMHDENRGKGGYGLEALLLSEFNFASWKDETAKLLKDTGNAADWSPEQRMERCRLDAWATRKLALHFEEKLRGQQTADTDS